MSTTALLTPQNLRALAKEARVRSIPAPLIESLLEAAAAFEEIATDSLEALERSTPAQLREVLVREVSRPRFRTAFGHLFTFLLAVQRFVDLPSFLVECRGANRALLSELASSASETAVSKVEYALDTVFDVIELGSRDEARLDELARNPRFMNENLGLQAYFLLILVVLFEALRRRLPHVTGVLSPLADELEDVAQRWFRFVQAWMSPRERGPSVSLGCLERAKDDDTPSPPGDWAARFFAA